MNLVDAGLEIAIPVLVLLLIFLRIVEIGGDALPISVARDRTRPSHLKGLWMTK